MAPSAVAGWRQLCSGTRGLPPASGEMAQVSQRKPPRGYGASKFGGLHAWPPLRFHRRPKSKSRAHRDSSKR
ncbi:MAG: hypothetical protein AW07_00726 [Candidatus Accumulibacter sp. SK-11]|nr:MAG: hypothetical protein AW07_00726 [Candidatus Accumulibacter sp. SK-11]